MTAVTVRTATGAEQGSVDLDDTVFGIEPNDAVLHQVVTAQLAARRAGTHKAKTRGERRGGGAKPWRQKGTGRARQGSIRAPQWRGGGIVHGPRPRQYRQRTPKKMIRLALRSALSDRAADGRVVVVDSWGIGDVPRTRDARAALEALELTGRVLVVLRPDDVATWKSFRNLTNVHLVETEELNAYDVLVADWVVFTTDTLPTSDGTSSGRAQRAAASPRAKPASRAATTPTEPQAEGDEPDAAAEPTKRTVKKKVVKKVVKKKVAEKPAAETDEGGGDS